MLDWNISELLCFTNIIYIVQEQVLLKSAWNILHLNAHIIFIWYFMHNIHKTIGISPITIQANLEWKEVEVFLLWKFSWHVQCIMFVKENKKLKSKETYNLHQLCASGLPLPVNSSEGFSTPKTCKITILYIYTCTSPCWNKSKNAEYRILNLTCILSLSEESSSPRYS